MFLRMFDKERLHSLEGRPDGRYRSKPTAGLAAAPAFVRGIETPNLLHQLHLDKEDKAITAAQSNIELDAKLSKDEPADSGSGLG